MSILSFVKRQFKGEVEVANYGMTDITAIDLKRDEEIIFIVNNEIDLINLMYVYTKVDNIFVWSQVEKINQQLMNLDNVTVLNLNQPKNRVEEQIRF